MTNAHAASIEDHVAGVPAQPSGKSSTAQTYNRWNGRNILRYGLAAVGALYLLNAVGNLGMAFIRQRQWADEQIRIGIKIVDHLGYISGLEHSGMDNAVAGPKIDAHLAEIVKTDKRGHLLDERNTYLMRAVVPQYGR